MISNLVSAGLGRITAIFAAEVLIDTGGPLFFPTGMTFGPDGALYISNVGFGPPIGQILKVEITD